ncbi:hypothetical protein CsSME_00024633 [Camellia sinensis var. sinensis]
MVLFLNILERPVPVEGQPADPELRKSWGWWKVKKWTVHILNRLYTRFGDLKLQNPENRTFAQMFQKNYAGKILEYHLNLLNVIRVGGYLPDRVTNFILQYLSNSLIHAYAVGRDMEEALAFVRKMKDEGIEMSLVTSSILVAGFAKVGNV